MLGDEGFRQKATFALDEMETQVVLPGVQRYAGGECGDSAHGTGLPDDELPLLTQTRGAKECRPVEPGGALWKLRRAPVIVALEDLLGLRATGMDFRDAPLELEDACRLLLGTRGVGERQDRSDVRLVAGADVGHLLRRIEVVVPVGHPQTAL